MASTADAQHRAVNAGGVAVSRRVGGRRAGRDVVCEVVGRRVAELPA